MKTSRAYAAESLLVRQLLLALMAVVSACGVRAASWTAEDKENIRHFFTSQDADLAALRLLNSGAPFSTISKAESDEIVRLKRLALSEAKLLKDEVLAKANGSLPQQFRTLYQQSLELQLRGLELGDNDAEFKGAALHDRWTEWFNANMRAIKIPK